MSIASIRKEYMREALSENDVDEHPLRQFSRWWEEAVKAEIDEVNAMTLSTVSLTGRPSARIVLLKGFDESGFVFFTNYESRKGEELSHTPFASLLFFWKELERQVRIEGRCEPVSEAESDAYFLSRPEGSRIGAWASPQSREIISRDLLEENIRRVQHAFKEMIIPRPPHWGGYRVIPEQMEFWQGRPSRLHDRIVYRLPGDDGNWQLARLAP